MCHVKFSNHQLSQNASNKAYEWTCPNYIHTAFPLYNRRNLDFDSTVADETTIVHINNCHIETLKNYQKSRSIAHKNCQSILSTFDEFAVMLKSYEFDIISLSETWLTNNQHQLITSTLIMMNDDDDELLLWYDWSISSRGYCQRSSPSRISDMPRAGDEPAQNLSSGSVEWSCAVVITTTPWRRRL